MIYDFTVYRKDGRETLAFTVEADGEAAARAELADRLAGVAITRADMGEWRVGVTVVRQGRAGRQDEKHYHS